MTTALSKLVAFAALACTLLPGEASAFGRKRARCQQYASAAPTTVTVLCSGTCKDGFEVSQYGTGDDYGKAQTNANNKIAVVCASHQGVRSYDSCTPVLTGGCSPSPSGADGPFFCNRVNSAYQCALYCQQLGYRCYGQSSTGCPADRPWGCYCSNDCVQGARTAPYNITAYFKNGSTAFRSYFWVRDNYIGVVVWQGYLNPGESVPVALHTSAAGYGDVHYIKEGQTVWTHKQLISAGQTVYMN